MARLGESKEGDLQRGYGAAPILPLQIDPDLYNGDA
jgi:hypothetical protein